MDRSEQRRFWPLVSARGSELVHRPHRTGSPDGRGRRGSRRLREALALAVPRAESAWEGLLRVLHHVCEVPVVPQHEVR